MYYRYSFLEFVLLLVLFHAGWNVPSTVHQPCPWEEARIVKHIVNKKFLPVLVRYGVEVPLDCPFHPGRDLLADDQEWTCPICGETFRCEHLLDIHWEGLHVAPPRERDVVPEDSVCLADFCDIMRCEVLGPRLRPRRPPPPSPSQATCDTGKLTALHSRCQFVIRQCIMGLLTTVSITDFRDIEEDLNDAICSYLTCDLYWQDFKQEVRQVPFIMCLMILAIVVGGFVLCYLLLRGHTECPLYLTDVGLPNGLHHAGYSKSYTGGARLSSPPTCYHPH